jgi:hypothetical protein
MILICSLLSKENGFQPYADRAAECFLDNCGIPYISVSLVDRSTLQLDLVDHCDKDYLICVLANLFSMDGGVEITGALFEFPIIIP